MTADPSASPKHSISVAAAIQDDLGRFLVIHRADNGRWGPPGGVLELGESIPDGLAREVHEETGLYVRPLALTGVYKNMLRGIVALVVRCEVTDGHPHTTDEARELAWVAPDERADRMSTAYSASDSWTRSPARLGLWSEPTPASDLDDMLQ